MLADIRSPADLRKLSLVQLNELAGEIRRVIVETTAKTGGHVAPNLGVVELTLALHSVFDSPRDRIFWDVGHQCYVHKLITGRYERFATLRQESGLAGFPKRAESEHDSNDPGHSGDSISLALGAAIGDRLRGEPRRSIAVIGDGSVVAGMAFEALNHAGELKQDLTVVLNDNEMSIAPSTGAMASYLSRVTTGRMYNRMRADVWNLLGLLPSDLTDRARVAARKLAEGLKSMVVPSVVFEELGFRYVGPVDGHSLAELIPTFERIRSLHGPVLVHVVTRKGQGYPPAIERPEVFHGVGPFDCETGECVKAAGRTFTGAFGAAIVGMAGRDDRVVAITAGMCLGTGLDEFRAKFPNRVFDVGICEQHAVTFGAGLALAGMRPFVVIYSTFLQRAFDQVIEDVCLQKLPVVLVLDRAGLVGEDGPTHHGVFDLGYLGMLPGMTVMAPMDEDELALMLEFARNRTGGPVAIRYPRGGSGLPETRHRPIKFGRAEPLREGGDGCVLALGATVGAALGAARVLAREGVELTVVNARFMKPLDEGLVADLARRYRVLVT
ncbi:MAG TPA: 1-deoxy-D-xylulose-5-phosphate synthase, partial [candidate division WOR-3 bacterium]|nr:1-deoxy-D-xylulose-5-phosphate synthase [candidate division WOR-3 bacterium]